MGRSLKALEKPGFIGRQIARKDLALLRCGLAVTMNDLAQDRLVYAYGLGQPVLVTPASENLQF